MSQYAIFIVALSQAVTPFELPSSKVPARTAAILRAVESAGTDVGREAAAVALARSPLAVSYYRAGIPESRTFDKHARAIIDKHVDLETLNRVHRRSAIWYEQKRIDLMIEVGGAVADEANRKKVVDGILDFVQALDAINREKGPFTRLSFLNPSIFRWHGMNQPFKRNLKIEYGANINLESGLEFHKKQVIAGRVSTRSRHWNACLLIVRDHIEETATRSDWRSCMVFSNSALSDIRDKRIHDSLIIVDGDLDVTGKLAISRSLVFVNGRIKTFNAFGISESYLAANGKITIQQVDATESTLFSRNTIRVPDDQRFRQVPRSEPFGLQFFQLSDVGVATNIHIGGAEITALSPFSPLRLFGLRVGDVITKVDDRAVDSTDALRRGLRTAYVREAGVFYLLRNGQAIDRIVLFGDYQLPK